MFIREIWYFPQFCTPDKSKYGYLEVFQRVFIESAFQSEDSSMQGEGHPSNYISYSFTHYHVN